MLPVTPLGWTLILLLLVLAALSVAPAHRGVQPFSVQAAPDRDDDGGENIPPPRREFAI